MNSRAAAMVIFMALVLASLLSGSATAQANERGRVARSANGQVGERLRGDQGLTGIKPMARVESRIRNRVQSRLRNRIDRYYDPQANIAAAFESADEQARTAGQLR